MRGWDLRKLASGLAIVAFLIAGVMIMIYFRGKSELAERSSCISTTGHVDGNFVDRGGHTLTLVEYDNIFKTRRNETTYDRVTQRMLNAGPGQRIEICYDADDATSIIKGRIMRELETTP